MLYGEAGRFLGSMENCLIVDGADASRRAIGRRIAIRFLSGASRRPSSECSRLGPAKAALSPVRAADPPPVIQLGIYTMYQYLILISLLLIGVTDISMGQEIMLDHVWIHVVKDAPEAKALIDSGFQLAPRTAHHVGQGTSSVFFLFQNAYLELIWVDEPEVLRQKAPEFAATLLGGPKASPFGIGLRRVDPELDRMPFPTSPRWAEWMKEGTSIEVAQTGTEALTDPSIFVVPRYMGWDVTVASKPEVLAAAVHQLAFSEVTGVRLHGPGLPSPSPAVQYVFEHGLVQFKTAENHMLELEFDGGRQEKTLDIRPILPLVINY
ncbi:MAG: VOC family protein [Candidatus Eisenbacteria bacterium]